MNEDFLGSCQWSMISDVELLQKIGSRLKELRLEQNMKQKELAEKAGLSMFSISQMETGHNTSMQSIVQFLRALDRLDVLYPIMSSDVENGKMSGRQRVSRTIQAPLLSPEGEDALVPNLHKEMKYTLPEDDSYSMAAEEDPRNL